jgi:hypothetical protein
VGIIITDGFVGIGREDIIGRYGFAVTMNVDEKEGKEKTFNL